ncbi:MAG: hypothetical protein HZT40_20150 [Candidatus Thiothrix singaporensis]|uniref:Uncharacterized protein n=1 Tax=Candidatus Thiothrix singaporensis TaxID=2799669 RepID=A0A7L6AWX3_9GAMM|nr:MAG: hypothetical protein HZT40_20150 [Candidatus Thiothrix singaporensis]
MAFEHERAQSKAEFNSPFRETGKLPLGTDPADRPAGFRNLEGGGFSVALKNGDSKGIDLTLTSDLLHLVCKLLDDAAQKSGWDIPALLQGVGDAAAPVTAYQLN